jgi:glutathione S-transferase
MRPRYHRAGRGHGDDAASAAGAATGTAGRREVERLSGSPTVPVLVTDSGEVISESSRIREWAEAHPAAATPV